jgi:D-alanyl-D-alanine carboxypeptidase
MNKQLALTIALALVLGLAACGADEEPEFGQIPPEAPGSFALPDPKQAEPAFAVFPGEKLTKRDLKRVHKVDGVVVAAPLKVSEVEVEGPSGSLPLQVASTSPLRFRSVAPDSTRDAEFVWTSLIGGRAVVTYEAAEKLGVDGADRLGVPGLDGLRVGAFAENGTPSNFADVLVSDHIVDELPGEPIEVLVIGTDEIGDANSMATSIKKVLPDARLLPLIQVAAPLTAPDVKAPAAMGEAELGLGGTMSFRILKNGWIEPDPAWVDANITQASVPILGTVTCHRVMIPQLASALAEIEREGLAPLIRPENYAGCYAPRFIDRNPDLPLSNHAFGLAVDLNTDTNALGTRGDMDPRVVEIFEKWGFEWGGRWDRPDPMHFELARLFQ